MLNLDTVRLLRIPFSFFLMPVYLFVLSESLHPELWKAVLIFIALHLCIYPASNGYNSFMDQDEGSIGGLRNPPKATRAVYNASVLLDIAGIAMSVCVSIRFGIAMLVYSLISRAYSYKKIRLKKYPVLSYLTVMFFQGWFVFYTCSLELGAESSLTQGTVLAATVAFFLIGGVYPLTQIYQHDEDRKHGDKTISMLVGYHGTFILTALMFILASFLLFVLYRETNRMNSFYILQGFLLPVLIYFFYWWHRVSKNRAAANFDHTMRMNLLASTCMNLCFAVLTCLHMNS